MTHPVDVERAEIAPAELGAICTVCSVSDRTKIRGLLSRSPIQLKDRMLGNPAAPSAGQEWKSISTQQGETGNERRSKSKRIGD